MTYQQKFIEVFGKDMWQQMIVCMGLADQFKEVWISPYKGESQPCEDCISRESLRQKLQEHRDFFVNAFGGIKNMNYIDKARVDEIDNCIGMVVNEPSVTPKTDILDKIRDEIEEIHIIGYATVDGKREIASRAVIQIIDKYKEGE